MGVNAYCVKDNIRSVVFSRFFKPTVNENWE